MLKRKRLAAAAQRNAAAAAVDAPQPAIHGVEVAAQEHEGSIQIGEARNKRGRLDTAAPNRTTERLFRKVTSGAMAVSEAIV
jgi:hypothetical protein